MVTFSSEQIFDIVYGLGCGFPDILIFTIVQTGKPIVCLVTNVVFFRSFFELHNTPKRISKTIDGFPSKTLTFAQQCKAQPSHPALADNRAFYYPVRLFGDILAQQHFVLETYIAIGTHRYDFLFHHSCLPLPVNIGE